MARGAEMARGTLPSDESSPGGQLRSVSLRGLSLGDAWGVDEELASRGIPASWDRGWIRSC